MVDRVSWLVLFYHHFAAVKYPILRVFALHSIYFVKSQFQFS